MPLTSLEFCGRLLFSGEKRTKSSIIARAFWSPCESSIISLARKLLPSVVVGLVLVGEIEERERLSGVMWILWLRGRWAV